MGQLILHLFGDYCAQSGWMANNKTKAWWPALCHATVYSLLFLLIANWRSWLVIWSTHLLIDRFRLARYLVWAKDWAFGGPHKPWNECSATGYPPEVPVWLSTWLMIAADNTLHLAINYASIRWIH